MKLRCTTQSCRLMRSNYSSKGLQVIKDLRYFDLIRSKGSKGAMYRTERSKLRTAQKMREILQNNLDDNSYFLSLTFSENLQDYSKANQHFKNWLKNYQNLKYMAVKELQERGAIHYHLVVFDILKEDVWQLITSWKHGRQNIKKIKNPYASSIANYFMNYLGKENQLIESNKKVFTTSRNLKQSYDIGTAGYDYLKSKYQYTLPIKDWHKQEIDIVDYATYCFGDKVVKVVDI